MSNGKKSAESFQNRASQINLITLGDKNTVINAPRQIFVKKAFVPQCPPFISPFVTHHNISLRFWITAQRVKHFRFSLVSFATQPCVNSLVYSSSQCQDTQIPCRLNRPFLGLFFGLNPFSRPNSPLLSERSELLSNVHVRNYWYRYHFPIYR